MSFGVEPGYRLIAGGGDMIFLTAGSQEKLRVLRAAMPPGAGQTSG